jgi:SagB-type dehydrogenase family enzyme
MDKTDIRPAGTPWPLPERLRILRDVTIVALEKGILIDGLGRPEIIQGPLAQTILPELLSLLDGRHTFAELENAFPAIPSEYLRTAVLTLNEWGLIEPADNAPAFHPANSETMSFFRRQISTAGLESNAYAACSVLHEAKVLLVSPGQAERQAESLARQLRETGVGRVDLLLRDRFDAGASRDFLVVALGAEEDRDWYEHLDEEGRNRPFSWLYAAVNRNRNAADIGPLFRPDDNSCYSCFRNTHIGSANPEPGPSFAACNDEMFASFTALEVINIIALPNLGVNGRHFRRLSLPQWEPRLLSYPRLPRCPRCRKEPFFAVSPPMANQMKEREWMTDTALVFEDCVGLESRTALNPAGKQVFSRGAHGAGEEAGRFPSCEHIPLYRGAVRLDVNALDAMRTEKKPKPHAIALDELATVMAITGGVREISEKVVRRWAATAGNLGSVELFLVNRTVQGLVPGFYYYEALTHALASLKKRTSAGVGEFMCRVLGRKEDDLPDALIVLTGAFFRLVGKYGPFAYRLVHFDAGAALGQLHLAANGMGLSPRTVLCLADDLVQKQFNLEPDEVPTAVVEISCTPRKEKGWTKLFSRPAKPSSSPRSWKAAHEFAGMELNELTAMLLDEGRTLEGDPRSYQYPTLRQLPSESGKPATIRLPKPLRALTTLEGVLGKRRSIRQYSQRPVEVDVLATVLHGALSADAVWPEEYRHSDLAYYVLARQVAGIAPGLYRYHAETHGLSREGPPLLRDHMLDLLVQAEFADVPVLIWITGNLAAACAGEGARGHRQLLLRAGAAGHRLWMAALSLGLSGCLVAGVVPGAARRLLGFDGYLTASLLAFAMGNQEQGLQVTPGDTFHEARQEAE